MAFCIRSERKIFFHDSNSSNPGPGQYIKISTKNNINEKRFYPPFHTSSQRSSLIKINDYPGPGSYNLDSNNINSLEDINYQQKFQDSEDNIFQDIIITNYNTSEKNSNNSLVTNIIRQNTSLTNSSKLNNISFKKEKNKNRSLSLKDINMKKSRISSDILNSTDDNFLSPYHQSERLGFLSQEKRFSNKIKGLNNTNTPGPGSYYESIISNINDTKTKKQIKLKRRNVFKKAFLVEKVRSLNRIVSIPSRKINGYIYEKSKNKMKKDYSNSEENNKKNKEYINLLETMKITNKNNKFNKTFQNYTNNNNSFNCIKNEKNVPKKELKLLINDRCLKYNNNSSRTNELVGPGSYNVSLKKNNNIINWSKGFNLKKINQKNEFKKKLKIIEEMRKNGEFKANKKNIYNKSNKKIQKILNPYHNKEQINVIKTNNLMNKVIDSFRNSFLPDKSEIPGPGYYEKELTNPKISALIKKENDKVSNENNKKKVPNMNYRKFQCGKSKKIEEFGILCERPINKSKSLEDLGPTTYFKQKNKYEPEKKNTIYKQLILGKTKMSCTVRNNFDFYFPDIPKDIVNNSTKINDNNKSYNQYKMSGTSNYPITERANFSIDNNRIIFTKASYSPGPGAYELSHNFIKPSFSNTQMMKSKVERFSDSDDGNPGPGSYKNIKNLQFGGKLFLKKIFDKKFKHNQRDKLKEKKIKTIIELNKKKNEIPGAGTYNIDRNNSIRYKIHSKLNFKQSQRSPFLNSSGRFTQYIKSNDYISPTSYEPFKYENIKKNKQYMIFNKAKRFKEETDNTKQNYWILASPGSYDLEFDWNKKSYNVLFSGN